MTPQELLKEVSGGHFRPAYYFCGEEDYRVAEAEKFITQTFLPSKQILTNTAKPADA